MRSTVATQNKAKQTQYYEILQCYEMMSPHETVIKTFQTVPTFRSESYNLQMDSPHFSDIDEESAINRLNPRDRKGSYKV